MTELFAAREKLGLSQMEMARLLGLKKSSICMAETGRRSLPQKARARLAFIYDLLQSDKNEKQVAIPDQKIIGREIIKLKAKLARLNSELEFKEGNVSKIVLFNTICQNLTVAYGDQISVSNMKWRDALLYEKNLQLERLEDAPTLLLKAKIKGLEVTIAFLSGAIQK